jgi:hypothetical protein
MAEKSPLKIVFWRIYNFKFHKIFASTNLNLMKTFILTLISILSMSCQSDSIEEIISKNQTIKQMTEKTCEKRVRLQFDTEDLVINFGQGWQNQSANTFQLEWLDDNTIKINSFYAISLAEMEQSNGFPFQNYEITFNNSFSVTIYLNQPSLWYIYGEHYHLFNINLSVDYCKPNSPLSKR